MLRYPELICAAVPELAAGRGFDQRSVYHAFNVYEHIARVLTVAGELALCEVVAPSPSLMWAAFLHDASKPDCFTVDHAGSGHFTVILSSAPRRRVSSWIAWHSRTIWCAMCAC